MFNLECSTECGILKDPCDAGKSSVSIIKSYLIPIMGCKSSLALGVKKLSLTKGRCSLPSFSGKKTMQQVLLGNNNLGTSK